MEKLEEFLENGGIKKDITFLVISAIALVISMTGAIKLPFDAAYIAIVLCGIPIILEAVIGLVTAFDIKADVLVSIALIASVIIGENFAAGEVSFIMQLGALLEELTVAKAREGIEKLVHLTPQTSRIVKDGKEIIVPAEQVKIDDIIRVLPGETIPIDGIIISGTTSINQAVMTGESLPVDKTVGDDVSSGTVNQFGSFDMKASRVGEDSSIQRMIKLVQSADAGKAKIVGLADRWAIWIVVAALSASVITYLVTGQIIRSVTILVVFCPCSLVLATPTAIMAAIGNSTKYGFLVREGDALERLAKVSKITFDKTGTLTNGNLVVTDIYTSGKKYAKNDIYRLAAGIEARSEHPLGKAVVSCYKNFVDNNIPTVDNFEMIPGRGVIGNIDGEKILAGNIEMLNEKNINISDDYKQAADKFLKEGNSVVYVAVNTKVEGLIVLADTIRKDSANMIDSITALGVTPVLLTGDNENTAAHIAKQLHIKDVHAGCLPEDKMNWIDKYQSENEQFCMIGDGVNDAPSLKKAYVGIAMGGIGSDIAIDAADIALVNDDIKELPHLVGLSRKMMRTIKYNFIFSMILNFVAIVLAITGKLNPVVGALVHNAGSVAVIINSALLLKWRSKK